jgi:Secretion system C-terminal sorting domain/Pregnancy-associated plasma protein-A
MKKTITPLVLLLLIFCFQQTQAQTITLPVVFHVVYNIPAENVPDTCLQHQLDVLNEDFNAMNPDIVNVPAAWVPIIGNMNINFVLASIDPAGNPTTGIERRQTTVTSFNNSGSQLCYFVNGGLDAWPDSVYLNIWICDLGSGLLGYAQFPGGNPATDGVVIDYRVTGRGSYCQFPYNRGRVGTHELGHWFGLLHFGPDNSCADIDQLADTPPYSTSNLYGYYSPTTVITDICNPSAPGVMWMNFETSVDDSAMCFFTQNQVDTMIWFYNNMRMGSPANGIYNYDQNQWAFSIYPSPSTDGFFTMQCHKPDGNSFVEIYSTSGQLIERRAVFQQQSQTETLNLSSYAEGLYFVVLISGNAKTTQRITILR